ncbi:TolC family outer membrane protein [Pleionea sp. CnH1-48]|uniref:TolC family outer membrane protein n=1 Tax=Pleionea sp. CnH1-48 TaxID=2954494 RepID=UPI002098139B|nr:TolC family outer membrane protein [Pleionea sp. CnH1-48]MCO7227405.1 TolC family outer membrane protein [Pleionea sp. CnH1-48]
MKTKSKWLTATGFLLSTVMSPLYADTSLLQIYQQALTNDPTILASASGLQATEERVNQSFADLLPSLSGSASYGTTRNMIAPKDEGKGRSVGLTLSQVIYSHGVWKGLDISKKQAIRAGYDHEATKQSLIIRTSQAYFNVLAAQDSLTFSQAEKKAIGQELEQTNQKHEVGLIAVTDVHEAQARYDQAIADEIAAQNTLDNAIEALREITGEYHTSLKKLKESFELRPPTPNDVESWMKESEKNNLNLRARTIDKDVAHETIKLRFSGHLPTLSLDGSYSKSTDTDFRIGNSERESSSLGLSLNIPIYKGGATQSTVKEAQHLYQQAVHNMEGAHRSAISQTRSAYLGVLSSISSVRALSQSAISSESALKATQAGFEVGTRTIVDVLLSTRTLYSAKRALARARYDYILNTLRLKQAAGTLTEKDLQSVNRLLEDN